MKKRIFATVMALLLSAAMLAGCGGSSEDVDRSSRNRRERSYEETEDEEDDSDDGGWLSKWNDGDSHPTDEDDSYFVGDDNGSADGDITQSNGSTSPASNDTQTVNSDVPSTGSNSAAGSSTPSIGSKSSADDYLNDMKAFFEFSETTELEDDDPMVMIATMQSLINNLHVKTPEGLAIKADLQDMVDLMNDLMLNMENWDEDIFDTALNRIMEISESAEVHMEAFEAAATAAGVDMDSLDELNDIFGL